MHDQPDGIARETPFGERTSLLRSPLGLVEDLRTSGDEWRTSPVGFSAELQLALPYRGLVVWQVAGEEVVGDANQVLFVTDGETFRLGQPLPGGYAELLVTPPAELLAELTGTTVSDLRQHALFRRRSRRADGRLQVLRARFLHAISGGDDASADELLVELLRAALAASPLVRVPGAATRRLLARSKEYVEAHLAEPIRLSDVARAVDASPAYLTDVFRCCEGLPLYRYVLQARLARALLELPRADDLTTLALDLGFSSHSHFTAAFRRAFAVTPSGFRAATRPRRLALAARRPGVAAAGSLWM